MSQRIIYTQEASAVLQFLLGQLSPSGTFFVADTNTAPMAGMLAKAANVPETNVITIKAGEEAKNIHSLADVWEALQRLGATRHSVVVNVGGGMVTDLGGFAAATFKRGVRFVNVPTTLLGAVDAAIGGKTGIDFAGMKNEVGAFAEAQAVIVSPQWFKTLPHKELLSGYAEMVKHGLLSSEAMAKRLLAADITHLPDDEMLDLLQESIEVKQRIVELDPTEQGLRKALNLGHTAGHAFEEMLLAKGTPVPHGFAVAWGLVTALVLSHLQLKFPSSLMHQVADFVRENYGPLPVDCDDYDRLLSLMRHDKKNADTSTIRFTLLRSPGHPARDQPIDPATITAALDITRDLI